MKSKKNIFCFGEVLWDVFPEGKQIGGAPLNVALRLLSYGYSPKVISAVGQDALGEEIIDYFNRTGLSTDFIQKDKTHPTGEVKVAIDAAGVATYDIITPVAWDNIVFEKETAEAFNQCHLFLYGSLALRNKASRKTLHSLLKKVEFKVFDVNLRPPFYSYTHVVDLMIESDFIKFNAEELTEICDYLGCSAPSIEGKIKFICATTRTQQVCVTLGANGAILFMHGNFYTQNAFYVEVQDTVGAGDSFLATLLDGILQKESPEKVLQRACAVGALVSSKTGANPIIKEKDIIKLMDSPQA